MFSNEQVSEAIRDIMIENQNHLNKIESQCVAENPNLTIIALESGKVMKNYTLLANFLGIFDGNDKQRGGFRESLWAVMAKLEREGRVEEAEEIRRNARTN